MKIRSTLLALAGAIASTGALAADLPTHKEAMPPSMPYVMPFSWTGFYIGGYVGGSFGNVSFSDPVFNGGSSTPGGFNVGGLAGFNYQMSSLVLGAEAEYGYNTQGAGNMGSSGVIAGNPYSINQKFSDTGIGRVRGRLGYVVQPNAMLYVAGGWTFANSNSTLSGTCCGFAGPFSVSQNRSLNGWNIGVGGEYAFTSNWIGRLEYIHDGFANANYNYGLAPGVFANRNATLNVNTIRAALEYKF